VLLPRSSREKHASAAQNPDHRPHPAFAHRNTPRKIFRGHEAAMEAVMLDTLIAQNLPQQTQLLTDLTNARVFFPIALCIIGTLFMAFGFKAYKWIVLSNFAAIGWWLGPLLARKSPHVGPLSDDFTLLASIAGAVLMGLIAWPLLKYTVAACGGMVGFFIGMVVWAYCDQPLNMTWAGGLVGMVLLGMLSFVLFKTTVILFTSVEGAALFVFGICALGLQFQPWQEQIRASLNGRPILLPLAVGTLTALALFWQHQRHGLIGHEGAPGRSKAGAPTPAADTKKK
jgi:hypothetical protein